MADPTRRWPALDIVARAPHQPGDDRTSASAPSLTQEGFLAAFLDDYSPTAIVDPPSHESRFVADDNPSEESGFAWRVFFASPEARDRARAALAASEWQDRLETAPVDVEDEGWAERSQAKLTAIEVDGIIVAPPWDVPEQVDDARGASERAPIVIVIEPSMGFGTGHHQSTRMCLRALQAIDLAGRRVLDLGTGSGVLAIAAAKLGAPVVLGVDDDPDAVDAARQNVELNGAGAVVRIERSDLTTDVPQPADLVLANLTGGLLVRHAAAVIAHAAPGGLLVLSGFTEDERLSVAHAFRDLEAVGDDREDGWIGLTLRCPS